MTASRTCPECNCTMGRLSETSWWSCPNGHRTRTPLVFGETRRIEPDSLDEMLLRTRPTPERVARRLPNRHDVKRAAQAAIRAHLEEPDPFGE